MNAILHIKTILIMFGLYRNHKDTILKESLKYTMLVYYTALTLTPDWLHFDSL